jgi:hypothetical protein
MQFFVRPGTEMEWYQHWKEARMKWHLALGLGADKYKFHDHLKLAHYANAAADIEFKFPFGFKELEGIHSRTDFDLGKHEEFSGKKLRYFDPELNESYIPYVVETSIGLDRLFLAVLSTAYQVETLADGSTREVLKFPAPIAPVKVAVLPLVNKFAKWAQDNPEFFTIMGVALAGIAAAVVAINIAMSINPITAIAIGIGLVAAAAVIAYKKFEIFRDIVDTLFGAIKFYINNVTIPLFQALLGAATTVFGLIASAWNNTVGKLAFTIPDWVPLLGGKKFAMPKIGGSGDSGSGLTSARAFEESQKTIMAANPDVFSAPPAVAPSAPGKIQNTSAPKLGGGSGGTDFGLGNIGPFTDLPLPNITINMDAGLISSPTTVGQDIIDAILAAQRDSGVVFAPAVTF